jgi:hypothetical protein
VSSPVRSPRPTPLPLVLLAWAVVAVPLGWGLAQSFVKSRPLFAGTTATVSATVPSVPPAASAR